jgi:hypothetical protein
MNKIFGIEEPLWIVCHDLKIQPIWMAIGIWKSSEGRVYEYHVRVGRVGLHSCGSRKSVMRSPLASGILEGFDAIVG